MIQNNSFITWALLARHRDVRCLHSIVRNQTKHSTETLAGWLQKGRSADQQIGRSNFIMNTTNGGFVYNPSKCMCAKPQSQPRFLCVLVRNGWIIWKRQHCAVNNDNWHNNRCIYLHFFRKKKFFLQKTRAWCACRRCFCVFILFSQQPRPEGKLGTSRSFTSFGGIPSTRYFLSIEGNC